MSTSAYSVFRPRTAPATISPIAGPSLKQWPLPPVARKSPSSPSTAPRIGCQRRHVVQPDAPPDAAHSGELRQPPGHALVDVLLELGVDVVVERLRIDVLVLLRESRPTSRCAGPSGCGAHVDPVDLREETAHGRASSWVVSKTTSCSRVISSGSSRPMSAASFSVQGPAARTRLSHSTQLSRDAHAADSIALEYDALDRRALERAAFEGLERLYVGVSWWRPDRRSRVRLVSPRPIPASSTPGRNCWRSSTS